MNHERRLVHNYHVKRQLEALCSITVFGSASDAEISLLQDRMRREAELDWRRLYHLAEALESARQKCLNNKELSNGLDNDADKSSTGYFRRFLMQNTSELEALIETEHGLLDQLVSNGVLAHNELKPIQHGQRDDTDVRRLVTEITTGPLTSVKIESLLKALQSTQHKHVSNFIRGRGRYTHEFHGEWPLIVHDQSVIQRLDKHRSELTLLIDSRNGLLRDMMSQGGINCQQKQAVDLCKTDSKRNGLLIDILRRGSLATYETFLQCLNGTRQRAVLGLLEPDRFPDCWPLSEENKSKLRLNYGTAIRALDTVNGLTGEMYSVELISSQQKQFVESASTQSEMNERLWEIVKRFDEHLFYRFIHCLNKTNQQPLARAISVFDIRNIDDSDIGEAKMTPRPRPKQTKSNVLSRKL